MKWDEKTKNLLARIFFIALIALMAYLSFIGKATAETRAEKNHLTLLNILSPNQESLPAPF